MSYYGNLQGRTQITLIRYNSKTYEVFGNIFFT